MQQGTSVTQKPVRNAKLIANIKLLESHSKRCARAAITRPALQPAPGTDSQEVGNTTNQPNTMALPVDPVVPVVPQDLAAQQPAVVPAVPADQPVAAHPAAATPAQDGEMATLKAMIIDLTAKVDRSHNSKSRSRSTSSKRSRRRRSTPERRGYTPSPHRRSSRRHRSRSPRRSSSRRSSSRRHTSSRRTRTRSRSPSRRRSSSSRKTSRYTSGNRGSASTPANDVDAALAAQYPSMGNPKGKKLPTRELSLEPYRCLPPDLRKKAKERRSRRDLTFPEHICGFIKMVAATLDPAGQAHAALQHAANVAQDAASLPWEAVREWTQACMANIEDGNATWHDVELCTNDRTRLSWIKGKQLEVDRHYPCPKFNRGTCDHRITHSAEGNTWTHECASCLHITGEHKMTHNASNCRQKYPARQYDDRAGDRNKNQPKGRRDKPDTRPKN